MNPEICKRVFSWIEEHFEDLRKAVRGHGDFYRVSTDQILRFADAHIVPVEHLLLISEAYGYYLLLLQIPAIKAIKLVTTIKSRHQPIVALSIGDMYSLSEMLHDLQLWKELYKATSGEAHDDVNTELVELFQL